MEPAPLRRGENWAFWLGIASLTCLGPITGVLAVILGAVVLKRARGSRPSLAIAGVIAGAFGTAAGILAIVVGVSLLQHRGHRVIVTAPPTPPAEQHAPPGLPPGHPPIGEHDSERAEAPTTVRPIGEVTFVQVSSDEHRSLPKIFESYRREHAPLIVYVRAPRCAPCKRFESTLQSPLMQAALGKSVLLALDAAAFEDDLAALRIDARDVPTFVHVSDDVPAHAVDAITGVEWDDDLPQNIAPIFTRFLAGTLHQRRQPPPFVGTML
jgi:hypothetical protein